MEPIAVVVLLTVMLFILIMLGVHVAVALGVSGFIGLWLLTGRFDAAASLTATTLYRAVQVYEFGAVPLFVLMGMILQQTPISHHLFAAAHLLMRRIRGSLAMATVLGNAFFAAITGTSIASAAAFSSIAFRPMVELGYDRRLAAGSIAGSSVLGMLIPPSVLMIIYGIVTQVSIGDLFLAGIIPGLVLTLMYCLVIAAAVRLRPGLFPGAGDAGEEEASTWGERWRILLRPWPVALLIPVVLGGIYAGVFNPTEASAVGTLGALLIALGFRSLTWQKLRAAVVNAGHTTASILLLIVTAQMFARVLALSGFINWLERWFNTVGLPPSVVLLLFLGIVILMGMILDSTSIVLMAVPVAHPILTGFGMDPIWVGLLIIVAVEIGLITPPFGLSVYSVQAAVGDAITIEEVFTGSLPFFIAMILFLLLLVLVPDLVLWLVRLW